MDFRTFYVTPKKLHSLDENAFNKAAEIISLLYANKFMICAEAQKYGLQLTCKELELAGYEGTGQPKFTRDEISFNGVGQYGCEDFTLTKDTRALIVKTRYNNYGYWLFFSMAIVDALAKDHFVTTDDCESDDYDVLFDVLKAVLTELNISIDMSRMNARARASQFVTSRFAMLSNLLSFQHEASGKIQTHQSTQLMELQDAIAFEADAEILSLSENFENLEQAKHTQEDRKIELVKRAREIKEEREQHLKDIELYLQ